MKKHRRTITRKDVSPLIKQLREIRRARRQYHDHIGRYILRNLRVSHFPKIMIPMSNGILGDPGSILFYADLDWGNSYCDEFILDAIAALEIYKYKYYNWINECLFCGQDHKKGTEDCLADKEINEIDYLYQEGKSINELSGLFGWSKQTVKEAIRTCDYDQKIQDYMHRLYH